MTLRARPPSRAGARRRRTEQRGVLQPGNRCSATWRARLDEHLGNFTVEVIDLRAADFLTDRARRFTVFTHLAALCGCCPSAIRMRAIHARPDDDPRCARRPAAGRRCSRASSLRCSPSSASGSIFRLRRHRREQRPDLCLAAVAGEPFRGPAGSPISTSSLRSGFLRPDDVPRVDRRPRRRLCADRLFLERHVFAPRGLRIAGRGRTLSLSAVLVHHGQPRFPSSSMSSKVTGPDSGGTRGRSRCARRSRSAISPMRSPPSCTARCRTRATG